MQLDEAIEVVDVFGSDQNRWPAEYKLGMESLLRSSSAFRDYVEELKSLDAFLDEWESGEDGVNVGEGDDKPTESGGDEDPEDDEDEDEGEDGFDDEFDDVDDAEEDDAEGDPEEGSDEGDEPTEQPMFGTNEPGLGTGAPLHIDYEDLKDTDSALEDILRQMINGGFDNSTQTHLTRDYDTIKPYEAPKHVDGLEKMEAEVKKVSGTLQKDLQRMMIARAQSYFVPGFKSGRLNAPSLHRLSAGDDRIFRRRHVAQTNKVAVSLVCDLSGSMGGAKCKTALMSAWAFSETLDKLGISNEVCGFTTGQFPDNFDHREWEKQLSEFFAASGLSYGEVRLTPVWMPIFKGYDEKFTPETKRRLAHMATTQKGMGSNNDAAAIEFAGERLRRRSETRKIMIVFSDGQPADGGVSYSVLHNSVKVNIANLEKQGVEVIGVGIEDTAVTKFYRKNFVIKKVAELPKFVMHELKALLS